jgi:signal transduction histidine kinase
METRHSERGDSYRARPQRAVTPGGRPLDDGMSARSDGHASDAPRYTARDTSRQAANHAALYAAGDASRYAASAPFLAEASRLLADSLDYEQTLATVAALALPYLGAWCIVDVVEADGSMRRLAVVHPDPAKQVLAGMLQEGWPPERDDPLGVPVVMATGQSEIVSPVTESLLRQAARTEQNLDLLRRLGIGSLLVVPLRARGDVLGAVTFVGSTDGHQYTGEDMWLAEELAARCAVAIDNARLYRDAQRALALAESASRAKSQLLAMTSHEIRTPINAIMGYTQLLDMGLDGPLTDEQRRKLERIQASSQYLLSLVDRILDTARAEAGRLTVQNEAVDLREVVDAAVSITQPQAAERSVAVDVQLDGAPPLFIGDPIRARQVVVNLLANACKFTEPGDRIMVSADSVMSSAIGGTRRRWTRIHVADTGAGIPEEARDRIFEPFVQADTELTRRFGGAGLGLAISRELARMMGGDLTVESQVGDGSRFTLWLCGYDDRLQRDAVAEERPPEHADLRLGAEVIMRRIVPIVDGYVERLREFAPASSASELELRDSAFTLLSAIAGLLAASGEHGHAAASDAIRDGGTIQRVVSELHGAQRRRLGWKEEVLERDYEALEAALAAELRRFAPPALDVDATLELVGRVLRRAERASVRGWQAARTGTA